MLRSTRTDRKAARPPCRQSSHHQLQEHVAISNHVYVPTHLVIADWFLDSMSDEARETLFEIAYEMEAWTREQGAATDEEMRAELEQIMQVTAIDSRHSRPQQSGCMRILLSSTRSARTCWRRHEAYCPTKNC